MRDLAGGVAQPTAILESRRPDQRPARFVQLRRAPEADVMAPSRVAADGLLEGQVLLSPEEEETAHRGVPIRPMEHRSGRDPQGTHVRVRVAKCLRSFSPKTEFKKPFEEIFDRKGPGPSACALFRGHPRAVDHAQRIPPLGASESARTRSNRSLANSAIMRPKESDKYL